MFSVNIFEGLFSINIGKLVPFTFPGEQRNSKNAKSFSKLKNDKKKRAKIGPTNLQIIHCVWFEGTVDQL